MDFITLGRTGLRVSRMGLGCGGHSRLGISQGHSEAEAEGIVRKAFELGVNFIDTAEGYRTEEIVGRAISSVPRDQVVISTKAGVDWENRRCTAAEMLDRIDACLRRLGTGYIDVFHLHGVSFEEYEYGRDELVPALQKAREQGKVRFIGITEQFINDPRHEMLVEALKDDCWDVMMVGFNMLNPSARERVLCRTIEKYIGTLCMFAVRRALSQPEALNELIQDLVKRGLIDANALKADDPLGFAWKKGIASSLQDAAYRFCRWEPGMDVILSGTGSIEHLEANADSIGGRQLPDEVTARLKDLFGEIDIVSGN